MDYELSVRQAGKNYRQYNINGENLIGVQKNEPFEIHFKNNTYQKIQVRFSVDGVDVVTGENASTKPTGKMWLVYPHSSMSLKAWAETDQGGSAFVFTDPEKGVTTNIGVSKAGIGLIAAAVYVETAPTYNIYNGNGNGIWQTSGWVGSLGSGAQFYGSAGVATNSLRGGINKSVEYSSSDIKVLSPSDARKKRPGLYADVTKGSDPVPMVAATMDSMDVADYSIAVGAGEFTAQGISHETGLTKPVLNEIVQIRYLSWSKLEKLIAKAAPKPNAFPGDKPEKRINLAKVPKVKKKGVEEHFARFVI